METKNVDVKSKGEIVAVVEVEVFDSVSEATEFFGEESLLEIINSGHKTSKMNEARAAVTGGGGKATKKDLEKFMQTCSDEDFATYRQMLQQRETGEVSDADISAFLKEKVV